MFLRLLKKILPLFYPSRRLRNSRINNNKRKVFVSLDSTGSFVSRRLPKSKDKLFDPGSSFREMSIISNF